MLVGVGLDVLSTKHRAVAAATRYEVLRTEAAVAGRGRAPLQVVLTILLVALLVVAQLEILVVTRDAQPKTDD